MNDSIYYALHHLNIKLLNSFSSPFTIALNEEERCAWPHEGRTQTKAFTWPDLMEKHQPSVFAQDPLVDFNIGNDQQV